MFDAIFARRFSLGLLAAAFCSMIAAPVFAEHYDAEDGYRSDRGDRGDGEEHTREYRDHARHDDEEDRAPENDSRPRRERDDSDARPRYVANGSCDRAALGAVLGGVAGGVIGAQVGQGHGRDAAAVIGAIVGAVVGSSIGRSMDEADRYCTGQALEYAPDGQRVAWRNPDTGGNYIVTPLNSYRRDGRNCRDYTTRVTVDGRSRRYSDTSCRQDNNSWRIVGR